jgi:hypothetical protein
MKIKTIIASALLLIASTALATDTKKEQTKKLSAEEMEYIMFAIIETDPDEPRDPETGKKEKRELTDGECHVMPDGHCLWW